MIPIYICEDNTVELAVIKKIITNLLFIEDYDMNIACCTTKPEDILSFLRPNMPVGIYFFDIDLRTDINGLALAEKIREYDPSGYIIFITSHTDMWRLTFEYKVSALDFIEKCETKYLAQKIAPCLSAIWKQYGKLNLQLKKTVPIQINGRILHKDIDELLYMEATPPHRIKFCTATQVHFSVENLNEFEKLLPDYFFRCHRSFIINLKNIIFYDEKKQIVYFTNQSSCPVSVRKRKALKDALNNI